MNTAKEDAPPSADGLEGRLLIAMPGIGDPRFTRAVVLVCAHSDEGAMGLIVNSPAKPITFVDLLRQLGIEADPAATLPPVRGGGPVEGGRGFVLHSDDYDMPDSTIKIAGGMRMTGTIDVLRAIALGRGPSRILVALGYTGWGPGQLEREIQNNGWLSAPGNPDLIFGADPKKGWERALASIGVSPSMLSATGGAA